MSDTPKDAKGIFLAALDIGDAAERAAFVECSCGDDTALRARVENLLRAYGQSGGPLDKLAAALAPTLPPAEKGPTDPRRAETLQADRSQENIGDVVAGRYKLVEALGEGGMGAVFMAQQTQPVKRVVALKLIKLGMDSKQVLARFEAERQALALMDHPNIAKVLDAGTTDSGRPFFVMELVKGVPITRFCDERQLSPRERLELFIPVCQAIQHAHQKGIIHRDIKPTNVLVALYDDRPVPKVIDFGVAKAAGLQLTDASLVTGFGAIVGTPEYMSPEQAQLNQLDIDTRSDVYALGVLLYELLTGTTPIDRKRLGQGALFEVLRIIREEEPPRPSTRLSTSDALASIAATRKTEPSKLAKLMRGELDWIVMKCLEKDRSRRYESANGLAHDLERYLADEAVEACPPSSTYRLRKLAGKYKKSLATATAFMILLGAAATISTLLAVWAKTAEREANQQRIASDEAKRKALYAEQEALSAKVQADKQRDEARVTAYAAGMQLAQRAWDENNVVRARELLAEVPQEAEGRKLRGFEWYYLDRLCHSETLTLKGHLDRVRSVAFSPDGRRLASGSIDATVRVWDSVTGKELLSVRGLGPVFCVAFSPDSRLIASGCRDDIEIWDSATGKDLIRLPVPGSATSVAFSPDGKRLASGHDLGTVGRIKIWDSMTGKELFAFGTPAPDYSVTFSPDGKRLASGHVSLGVGMLKIWDSATGKELFDLKGHAGNVWSVAFSPDGKRLASADVATVRIWDTATGKELLELQHGGFSVTFSPDGRRLALARWRQPTVEIWDSATGAELFDLKGHGDQAWSVAFSPDGERLASAADDRTAKIWDCEFGKERLSLKGPPHTLTNLDMSVVFTPDGQRLAAVIPDNRSKIWDITTGKELSLKDNAGRVSSVISPNGQCVASGNRDGVVTIWDTASGKELYSVKGVGQEQSVAVSPDGRRLASGGGDNIVRIWESVTGKELLSLKGHAEPVMNVAFSPEGQRLASGSDDNLVKIWDSATGREVLSLEGDTPGVSRVAFSPDGRWLASGSHDRSVKIWDTASGSKLLDLRHGAFTSVVFGPDGKTLASFALDDRTVKIWEIATGQLLLALRGHASGITSVAFSPDGQRLISGSDDGTIKIWDSATGKELFGRKCHSGPIWSVAFSADGQRVASADTSGPIHVWESVNVSAEIQHRRAITQMVADLFGQRLLRSEVLGQLRSIRGMSPSGTQEAITEAETYSEDPVALNEFAWSLLKLPGAEISGYRRALRYVEEACQLDPNNSLPLITLGMAYYRVGNYEKALAALLRSDQMKTIENEGTVPADLAFLAMAQQHLGHAKEAHAQLQRLRVRMKNPRWAKDEEAQGFLREAEALLAKPKTPAGKQSAVAKP